jgi:two-component system, NtrC family, response regulator GlrR
MDTTSESLIQRLRETQGIGVLIGEAPIFRRAIAQIPTIAQSNATVLICGETGTGKELVARAIHYLSPRAAFPFIAVNCGALPDTLLEDELFGHERGAFTDAQLRQPGLIAQAEKGTLFLDEVGTLTGRAQAALLRVLQDKTYRMLGSRREALVDARFVAATNASLGQMVEGRTFRADLYYRLCVFTISLPPLRDHREDIPLLAAHFFEKHASPDRPNVELSSAARALLLTFDWPGNVRQLEHAILRALQVCQANVIEVEDLGLPAETSHSRPPAFPHSLTASSFKAMKKVSVDAFEREYLAHLMAAHHGNVSQAALAAGKDRRDLGRLLKKHHIDPKAFVPGPGHLAASG